MSIKDKAFTYCLTKDIDVLLNIRISNLVGLRDKHPFTATLADPPLKFTGLQDSDYPDLYVTAQLHADNKPLTVPVRTAYKPFRAHWTWNEWLSLPIKVRDLPANAQLAITVWDVYGPRKVVPVGGTTFQLFGKKFTLRKGKHKLYLWPDREADGKVDTTTPSKVGANSEMDRLEKLMKRHERNEMPCIEWLDNLAFRQIEKINKKESTSTTSLFLYIDLPKFDFPLIFSEPEYTPPPTDPTIQQPPPLGTTMTPIPVGPVVPAVIIQDPEIARENPVEAKHRRLVRSHRNGPLDRDLKPNSKIRDELNEILKYPPTHPLTTEEKDLVWKFRFYLTRDKRALTKFLKCVMWTDPTEVRQAVDMLPLWADPDVDDALELLGRDFEDRAVRGYAVGQLRKADDDDLLLYLLQLVQALKFEHFTAWGVTDSPGMDSPLAQFLIERAVRNPVLGNYFHWYLMVECTDPTPVNMYGKDLMIGRKMYGKVAFDFMKAMEEIPSMSNRREILRRQSELIVALSQISRDVRAMKEIRSKKIERLRSMISDPKGGTSAFPTLASFAPLPLPLDPRFEVGGLVAEKASVYNSNLQPLRLFFSTVDEGEYPVIFKTGDDLRQDQLVIQIITLMDKLLRKENLDLRLTPYKVLATGSDHGLMQFIPSASLANVLTEHNGNLLAYLRRHHPDENSPSTYGVDATVMDTYIKSCAGYCVITYLLGVGDRHLDNLLLSPDGNLFHVDFGFILGRDPKPFPPPMKLCKEMIEAMGGANSAHYQKFRSHCFTAFIILRKNANLILNLFALMVDANVPDIKIEPDKAVLKYLHGAGEGIGVYVASLIVYVASLIVYVASLIVYVASLIVASSSHIITKTGAGEVPARPVGGGCHQLLPVAHH
ncbi:phosphatidylinositol 3-kinase [Jimgerdemannia flammicorona]|uniref:Phosphatidylinositol 3-kinase VPS34 n=1 Tax=Jimgerdemannia flammicorona TaxID=994334 RepID=A0A433DG71_9FUNG|nr:phosphatidylinositol 3-kinase [Jimgerdemannia flammicorona]